MTQNGLPPARRAYRPTAHANSAPGIHAAFEEFSGQVRPTARSDEKTKQLIAVAPFPLTSHSAHALHPILTRAALREGADERELMEAIWVAAELRAGGAYAHSTLALDAAGHANGPRAA